jgi:hypothetical protein
MKDEPFPPPPTGFKPCDHVKFNLNWVGTRMPAAHYYYDSGGYQGVCSWDFSRSTWLSWAEPLNAYLGEVREGLENKDLSFSHDDLWRLSQAWEKMKPKLEPQMDLLVFLAEFSEVPALLLSLKEKFLKVFTSLGEDSIRYIDGLKILKRSEGKRGVLKVVANETADSISNEWLEYNFALAPLVDDLIGLINGLLSFRKALEELEDGACKPQKAHASYTSTEEGYEVLQAETCGYCASVGGTCPYGAPVDDYESFTGTRCRILHPGGVTTRIGVTAYYQYTLPPEFQGLYRSISGLAGALGINPGVGTIWELIPFSFVLDWVWPIGNTLNKLKVDAVPVKTRLMDICFTKRVTTPILIQGRHLCPLSQEQTYATGQLDQYKRIVGSEFLTSIPAFRWPNWVQLSLGAAIGKLFSRNR